MYTCQEKAERCASSAKCTFYSVQAVFSSQTSCSYALPRFAVVWYFLFDEKGHRKGCLHNLMLCGVTTVVRYPRLAQVNIQTFSKAPFSRCARNGA